MKPSAPSLSKLSSLSSLAQIQPAPTTLGLPKISPGSPKVEPDSSSKRWENTSSLKSHKHPVSAAAGAAHLWRGPMSGTMMRITNGVTRTEVMIKIMKEVENANNNAAVKRARAHTTSAPQGMTLAGWASMADLLNPVIPRSIPIQRNDHFAVEADHGVVSTGIPAHQNAYAFHHLHHFIPLLSLHTMHLLIRMQLSGH